MPPRILWWGPLASCRAVSSFFSFCSVAARGSRGAPVWAPLGPRGPGAPRGKASGPRLEELREEELREQFVRGSGPGGQATNKTSNCVVLKHLPSGIVVKCHQTRSLETNRKLARGILRAKLDEHTHGDASAVRLQRLEGQRQRAAAKAISRRSLERKRAFQSLDPTSTSP
ncbi:mitochondrial translation release factor in rescue [Lampetra fluviatilis]